jgi:hypothetical protein
VELLPVFPNKDLQPSQQVSPARTFKRGVFQLGVVLRLGPFHILAGGFVGECFVQGQPFELVDLSLIQGADAQVPDNDVEDSNRVRSPER